jgi:hypothetical protein
MKLFINLLIILFFSGSVFVACGPTAYIEKDDTINFDLYKTFAWAEMKDQKAVGDIMENRIREAISDELQKTKGWKKTTRRPDVLLNYDVLVERNTRTQSDPVYSRSFSRTFYNPYRKRFYNVYYPSQFLGYDRYDVTTKEGTITVTMIDARTEKTVMQGWATEEIGSGKISEELVNRVVKAIFKKFETETR